MTDKLLGRIRELEGESGRINETLRELRQQWAAENCPFLVGDVVRCCGFVNKGKKMIVDRILWCGETKYVRDGDQLDSYEDGGWKVIGRMLKKDGNPSLRKAEFVSSQYAKSLEEKR